MVGALLQRGFLPYILSLAVLPVVDLEKFMGDSTIDTWKPIFEELVLDLEVTAGPDDADGTWHEALARFSRHSFARLLVCAEMASADEAELALRVEIALGPPPSDPMDLAPALESALAAQTDLEWAADLEGSPWVFRAQIGDDDPGRRKLRKALSTILKITDRFDDVDSPDQWLQFLSAWSGDDSDASGNGEEKADDAPTAFETIGTGASEAASQPFSAALTATALTRVEDQIHVVFGFKEVLTPGQLSALTEGLEHHLHTKFDVQVQPLENRDRPELRLPKAARTVLGMALDRGPSSPALASLRGDVEAFCDRLQKFSSFGVDPFEYLGVGDTVLADDDSRRERRSGTAAEQTLSFRTRSTDADDKSDYGSDDDSDDADGVVLDLAGGSGSGGALESGNYTDARLQRDDADSALVDLVLRHPGYSDRRIAQVLSILLSIEYFDARKLADQAPCVIAWGISQSRARKFKDVIESAGGKTLLVEPDTFGSD